MGEQVCGSDLLGGQEKGHVLSHHLHPFWHSQPCLVDPAQRSLKMPLPREVNNLLSTSSLAKYLPPDLLSKRGMAWLVILAGLIKAVFKAIILGGQ